MIVCVLSDLIISSAVQIYIQINDNLKYILKINTPLLLKIALLNWMDFFHAQNFSQIHGIN